MVDGMLSDFRNAADPEVQRGFQIGCGLPIPNEMLKAIGNTAFLLASVDVEVAPLLWASVQEGHAEALDAHEQFRRLVVDGGRDVASGGTVHAAIGHTITAASAARVGDLLLQVATTFEQLAELPLIFVTEFAGECGPEEFFAEPLRQHRLIPDLTALVQANFRFLACPLAQQIAAARIALLTESIWQLDRSEWSQTDQPAVERIRSGAATTAHLGQAIARLREESTIDAAVEAGKAVDATGYVGPAPPLVVAVDNSSCSEHLILAAACLDSLGSCCDLSLHAVRGECDQVALGNKLVGRLSETGRVMRVLAAWLRALGALGQSQLCDLCYRHRATRKRCREHKASGTQNKVVRHASWVLQHYLQKYSSLILSQPFDPKIISEASQREIDLCKGAAALPPEHSLRISMLRAVLSNLEHIVHPDLAARMSGLLEEMVGKVESLFAHSIHPTSGLPPALYRKRHEATSLLSLPSFLTHVYSSTAPRKWSQYGIQCLAIDPDHPLIETGALDLAKAVEGFLRHKAWTYAMEEQLARSMDSSLTAAKVNAARRRIAERGIGLHVESGEIKASIRQIALELGVSHTAVRKAIERELGDTKRIKRSKPF